MDLILWLEKIILLVNGLKLVLNQEDFIFILDQEKEHLGFLRQDIMMFKYTWIERFQLWDCTDGKIHGGGKTQNDALEDYYSAQFEESIEQGEGWQ